MIEFQPVDENTPKDQDILLHEDWDNLTIVGYWGAVEPYEYARNDDVTSIIMDDGEATWRVRWDNSRIDLGFGSPTHWAEIPKLPPSSKKVNLAQETKNEAAGTSTE